MAFQTGTLNQITDVTSILDSFLLSNGWVKTANSVVITVNNITGTSANVEPNLTTASSAFDPIPVGAKATWAGQANNCFVGRKITNTQIRLVAAGAIANVSGNTNVTFTWDKYSKGNKYFNFAATKSFFTSATIANYILCDLYHLPTGTNNKYTNVNMLNNALPTVRLLDTDFPCTYDLFSNTNPDTVSMCFNLGVDRAQHFHVGDLQKLHSSSYVGGEFFTASSSLAITTGNTHYVGLQLSDTSITLGAGSSGEFSNSISFAGTGNNSAEVGIIHAEIDGNIYPRTGLATSIGHVTLSEQSICKYFRGLNNWNSQVTLVTPEIQFNALAGFKMDLGVQTHLRLVRVDNYNTGDEITLGTDVWKVYPVSIKNITSRNSTNSTGFSSGTAGFAVRKVV